MFFATPSGRSFYMIEGKKSEAYVCFGHYCSCPSHTFSVLIKSEAICCKHQLAVQLAEAMSSFTRCKSKDIRDDEYSSIVCNAWNCPCTLHWNSEGETYLFFYRLWWLSLHFGGSFYFVEWFKGIQVLNGSSSVEWSGINKQSWREMGGCNIVSIDSNR